MVKCFNFLLLGETGIGKSTFINSFVNYQKYHTLETAVKGGFHQVIATTFTVADGDSGEIKTIISGNDINESLVEGQSQTQSCKAYLFRNGEDIIRIIDTPSIGDTRGMVSSFS